MAPTAWSGRPPCPGQACTSIHRGCTPGWAALLRGVHWARQGGAAAAHTEGRLSY